MNNGFSMEKVYPSDMPKDIMYRKLLDSIPVGAGIFEIHESGVRALFLNEYYYKTLGYPKEDYADYIEDITKSFFKSERSDYIRELSTVRSGNEVSINVRSYCADHSIRWLKTKAVLADNSGEDPIIFMAISDISDQKAIENSLSVKNERYRIFEELSHSREVLFNYKPESDYMTFSYNTTNEIHHYEIPNYTNYNKVSPIVHPDYIPMFSKALREACSTVTRGSLEYKSLIIDPTKYLWCRVFYSSIADESGKITDVFGKIIDIDDEVKAKDNMIKQAQCDPLTKIYNKSAAFEKIDAALEQGIGDVHFAVIDIDNFKSFNDTHGHMSGDDVLRTTADLIISYFPDAVSGRFGGDEFIIFVKDFEKPNILEELNGLSKNAYLIKPDGSKIKITYSIGVIKTRGNFNCAELFIEADEAMYEAKRGGKDKIVFKEL